jgi:hypothetical protein
MTGPPVAAGVACSAQSIQCDAAKSVRAAIAARARTVVLASSFLMIRILLNSHFRRSSETAPTIALYDDAQAGRVLETFSDQQLFECLLAIFCAVSSALLLFHDPPADLVIGVNL